MAGESRVIFVLVDGLNAETASCMGYLAALTHEGTARRATMECELPPLSRPLYHCIFSGRTPCQSGVVHNDHWTMLGLEHFNNERRAHPDIFSRAAAAGLITAAAAYYFVSELYCAAPYDPVQHRLRLHGSGPIHHGMFYHCDEYPDEQLLVDAELLRRNCAPHFLLVHSMGVDNAGHGFGADSPQYRNAARGLDMLLARFMPVWLAEGYDVIVTSDHGMHADRQHNDLTPDVRCVPLWMAGSGSHMLDMPTRQTDWCALLCRLLRIPY